MSARGGLPHGPLVSALLPAERRTPAAQSQAELRAAREALSRADYWLRAARADLARSDMVDGIDALDISVRRIATAQAAMRRAADANDSNHRMEDAP